MFYAWWRSLRLQFYKQPLVQDLGLNFGTKAFSQSETLTDICEEEEPQSSKSNCLERMEVTPWNLPAEQRNNIELMLVLSPHPHTHTPHA